MDQGYESPLFCRHDTPPRSGVPPGYVSIRPLLLQRQQSESDQQDQYSAESGEEAFQSSGQARPPNEGGQGRSSALIDFDDGFADHGNDSASAATESDYAQYTSLPSFLDQVATQSYDLRENAAFGEGQVSPDDSLAESLELSDGRYEQTVEAAQPQRGPVGDESPLFCRDNTPPRSDVPRSYRSLRSLMGTRARRSQSPVAQNNPGLRETSRGLETQHRQSTGATQLLSSLPLTHWHLSRLLPRDLSHANAQFQPRQRHALSLLLSRDQSYHTSSSPQAYHKPPWSPPWPSLSSLKEKQDQELLSIPNYHPSPPRPLRDSTLSLMPKCIGTLAADLSASRSAVTIIRVLVTVVRLAETNISRTRGITVRSLTLGTGRTSEVIKMEENIHCSCLTGS
ncbi:uncharacterized protein M437DRAFT_69787 [Aureobasidium melanogenum CBS 110374]|uniref:Uncharacterized protein n=1 Tax=Aureobasidium melanogenum (strain CBS 110374) TaxID=1043003 RepID=A0A074VD98_AURM1|nr:uncharacterized protein M437DRAFT_69787 [Aureobasidium melanogenum CBS 110374]KEQ58635.1 hypothetical protein M437DRAFT_69787 [Aureobasidium melanogenum CBS 110374]